ncbi:hypothetical protein D3C77_395810 [compost metagenome]
MGSTDGCLDCGQLGACCNHGGIGGVVASLLLIEQLLASVFALEDFPNPLEFLAGQQQLALAQLHVGLGGGVVFLGAQHFGLGLVALRFEGAGIDTCQQLALADCVAFVDQHFGQAAGNLAGNLHFGGFESAVAHAQAVGQAIMQRLPVAQATSGQEQGDQGAGEEFRGMLAHQSASCCIRVRL